MSRLLPHLPRAHGSGVHKLVGGRVKPGCLAPLAQVPHVPDDADEDSHPEEDELAGAAAAGAVGGVEVCHFLGAGFCIIIYDGGG